MKRWKGFGNEYMEKIGFGEQPYLIYRHLDAGHPPSMPMLYTEQNLFIKNHLGPAFVAAGLKTKIIIYDHNLDRPDYPLALLNDPDVAKYVEGSAFHHYGGDINTMASIHLARPDKSIYFTEQMVTESPTATSINIASQVKRLVIGTMRNRSRNLILWNLAADKNNDPHTNNGGVLFARVLLRLKRTVSPKT
jgi:glucosylceramidase